TKHRALTAAHSLHRREGGLQREEQGGAVGPRDGERRAHTWRPDATKSNQTQCYPKGRRHHPERERERERAESNGWVTDSNAMSHCRQLTPHLPSAIASPTPVSSRESGTSPETSEPFPNPRGEKKPRPRASQ
ncbi:hypothetical protein GW17_00061537, partial [Ensete ventricosum]